MSMLKNMDGDITLIRVEVSTLNQPDEEIADFAMQEYMLPNDEV